MKVDILSVEQSYSLETGKVENFLVFRLPSGALVRAKASEEDTNKIVDASVGPSSTSVEEDESPLPASVVVPNEQPVADLQQDLIYWPSLPEEQLRPDVKAILAQSDIPSSLPLEDLKEVVKNIMLRIRQEQGKTLAQAAAAPPPQGVPPGPATAPVGPQPLRTAGRRTVPKDDLGYPIVPGGVVDSDPGEVRDDDGVAQL